MKTYLYDLHIHTSESSACAASTGAEMAENYKKLGYDGIFITDHFLNANTAVDRSLPWDAQVDGLCRGFENARARGAAIGLDVFFGFEYSCEGTDFLIYGLDKDWLKAHPEVMTLELKQFLRLVRESGAGIVHAHPFRKADYIREMHLVPDHTDAAEVVNLGNTQKLGVSFNLIARRYAELFGLGMVSGSDAHWAGMTEAAGIRSPVRFYSAQDYVKALRKKQKFELLGE
ncbi:MAG: PHP-associated domain-containing protein [Oscillospiraceae bacterium]